jgi:hypothetical protein
VRTPQRASTPPLRPTPRLAMGVGGCCTAPPPPPVQHAPQRVHPSPHSGTPDADLRHKLAGQRPRQLRARAAEAGIGQEQLDEADEAANPKDALIELLVAHGGDLQASRRAREEGIRVALSSLRPRELRERAVELDIGDELIDQADEAPQPKAALIELLVAHSPVTTQPEAVAEQEEAVAAAARDKLRAELVTLRPRELRARATEVGIGQEQLDEADEAAQPKAALIELLLVAQVDGTTRAAVGTVTPAPSPASSTPAVAAAARAENQVRARRVAIPPQRRVRVEIMGLIMISTD